MRAYVVLATLVPAGLAVWAWRLVSATRSPSPREESNRSQ